MDTSIDALINDISDQGLAWYSVVSGNPITPTAGAVATGQAIPVATGAPLAPGSPVVTGTLATSGGGAILVVAIAAAVLFVLFK